MLNITSCSLSLLLCLISSFAFGFVPPPPVTFSKSYPLYFSKSDYVHAVEALARQLRETHEGLKKLEILLGRLEEMETHNPHLADIPTSVVNTNLALKQAVSNTKAAMELHGVASTEAHNAMNQVDKVLAGESVVFPGDGGGGVGKSKDRYSPASIEHHHSYNSILDKELLRESMQAIEQILALEKWTLVEGQRLENEGRPTPTIQDSTPGMQWLSP